MIVLGLYIVCISCIALKRFGLETVKNIVVDSQIITSLSFLGVIQYPAVNRNQIYIYSLPRTSDSHSRCTQLPPKNKKLKAKLSRATRRINTNENTPKKTPKKPPPSPSTSQVPPHNHTTSRAPPSHSPTTA